MTLNVHTFRYIITIIIIVFTVPSTNATEMTPGPESFTEVALNESQNISMSDFLQIPKITTKQGKSHGKSLSYTANCITKQLFVEYDKTEELTQNKVEDNRPKLARKRKRDRENGKSKCKHVKSKSACCEPAKKDLGGKMDRKVEDKGNRFKRAKKTKILVREISTMRQTIPGSVLFVS